MPEGGVSSGRGWRSSGALFGAVSLSYLLGALLAWHFFADGGYPAFFPPAGVTVAALLLTPRTRWPVIVVSILVTEIAIDLTQGNAPGAAIGYAAANAIEPLTGASVVLAWCGGRPALDRRQDLMKFFAGAAVVGPVAGGAIGGAVITALVGAAWDVAALRWWAGDVLGVLVVGTPILMWSSQWRALRARWIETTAVLTAAALLPLTAFWHLIPPSMTMLPLLVWAAIRLGILGAALAGAVVAMATNQMVTAGHVLFPALGLSPTGAFAVTQAYLAFMVLVAILIAQEVDARVRAVGEQVLERRERIRIEGLAELAQQLAADLTPADIGKTVGAAVLRNVGAQALTIGLVDHDCDTLRWVTIAGYPADVAAQFADGLKLSTQSAAADVVLSGRPMILRDVADFRNRYPATAQWMAGVGSSSSVIWPLITDGRTVGTLSVLWRDPQPLGETQIAYVSAVASTVTQALIRAQIYADENARAAVLLAAVLPSEPPEIAGLDVAVSYHPADGVHGLGGDWYDLMPIPDTGTVFLGVGDVVGHGLSSVEDMAQLRSAARALAVQGLSPAGILTELNNFARQATKGNFATMVIAVVDPETRTLTYAHAGHPPALLRRHSTGEVIELTGARGPLLGPLSRTLYPEARITVETGDVLVLYTDGLVEARSGDIDAGIADVAQLVAEWDEPLGQACERLSQALSPAPRRDDVCVLAVGFHPPDQPLTNPRSSV